MSFPDFRDWAIETWETHHEAKHPWGAKEFKSLKTAYQRLRDMPHARRVWHTYLQCENPFYAGHCPSKFLLGISEFVAAAAKIREEPAETSERDAWDIAMIEYEILRKRYVSEGMSHEEAVRKASKEAGV